ncbi:HAUS augmin-like complex subunit 5 [Corythoichthys intestinalis]|uniref:HAUS augmin-like complex subunit 5 n=1 Tax=Corythoichthys intestinalis TaxID=161448 RepID=UPI0025A5DEC1|nr:HAUS augmin-like complex subunit 5 [Corythoichthys intestinalis]XP_057697456.1 HAUS augmin-like complex subunit 5 [Corythoichthys intestinalis]XP_061791032.1 HAUS augmin-like complex subunit 5 [Nerophis lumbriciformis]
MAVNHLVKDLKLWATEEFNLPSECLPPNSYFRALCAGKRTSIWKYVICHVFQQRTVKLKRDNLQWYKVLQDKEAKQNEGQNVVAKMSEIQIEIQQLRSEVNDLDAKIRRTEEHLATQERSISSTWAEVEDSQCRSLLLHAFKQRCVSSRKILSSDIQVVCGFRRALELLARKAEVEVLFGNGFSSNCDVDTLLFNSPMEPQVLRQVRQLCNERAHLYRSLQECELKKADNGCMTDGTRNTVFQSWLSAVENLVDAYPISHILSALQHLLSQEEEALVRNVSSQDVKALGLCYETNNHLDVFSDENDNLPSVEALLKAAWQELDDRGVELSLTQNRVQQLQNQLVDCRTQVEENSSCFVSDHNKDKLALSVLELNLQCVMKAAARDHIQDRLVQLDQHARSQQEVLRNLHSQWKNIIDSRQQVVHRQGQINSLIKGNSLVKTELVRMCKELQVFLEDKVVPQCKDVVTATNNMRNSISKEVNQLSTISLQALDRRTVNGMQRIPTSWLSIHRLQSPTFGSLCLNMAFPLYRAPEELCAQACCDQLEWRFLCQLQQLHCTTLQKSKDRAAHLPASSHKALLSKVKAKDETLLKSLVPRVRFLTQKCAESLSYEEKLQTAISDWWDQPARNVVPDVRKGGLTFQQWLEKWRLAAKV